MIVTELSSESVADLQDRVGTTGVTVLSCMFEKVIRTKLTPLALLPGDSELVTHADIFVK